MTPDEKQEFIRLLAPKPLFTPPLPKRQARKHERIMSHVRNLAWFLFYVAVAAGISRAFDTDVTAVVAGMALAMAVRHEQLLGKP